MSPLSAFPITDRDVDRFQKFVVRENGCLVWRGAKNGRTGYGIFRFHGVVYAHRFALKSATSVLKDEDVVMHSCDNPPCVNPAHLSHGTASLNAKDMYNKGRSPLIRDFGPRHNLAKLSTAEVAEIRRRKADGERSIEIALRFGITREYVNLLARNLWRKRA